MSDKLHTSTRMALEAARAGVAWVNHPDNEATVGLDRKSIDKRLRRIITEASKLDRSIDKPMCVGVFGPSQAGKSYLVSVLARRSDQPLLARFDGVDEPVDFLADINPGGERESTGVVTRFSVRPQKGPPGFPVCLRLLSEIDIIKVIVNSYFLDGDQKKTTLPEPEAINASLSEAQKRAENSQPRDNQLTTEDVWDIQEYFERTFDPRAIEAYRSLWDEAAVLAPRLSLPDRAEMFGLLWGNLEPLTGLYRQLTATPEKLEFTTEAFCPMSALLPRTQSIIDVQTLSGLGKPDQPKLEIQSENGKTVAVDRPIVTACRATVHFDRKATATFTRWQQP